MRAQDIQCVMCGAKPGWECLGAPDTARSGMRIPPHQIRRDDARMAEQVAAARTALELVGIITDDPLGFTPAERAMFDHGIEVIR